MARSYATLLDLISQNLSDTGSSYFSDDTLDLFIPLGVDVISQYLPRQTKETLTTTADSRELTLTAENKRNLLWVDELEYKVSKHPQQFRNFTRWGDVVLMGIDFDPVADESVYLYLAKKHILQKEVGTDDLYGTIAVQAAASASSIVLSSLGTGTINEHTSATIESDSTAYTVTADATITANWATVYITPVTAQIEAVGKDVTFSLSTATLNLDLEKCLVNWVTYKAMLSYCNYLAVNQIVTGDRPYRAMRQAAFDLMALTERDLQALVVDKKSREYVKG